MTKIKTKLLLGLVGGMITNGNKHLGTFESPIGYVTLSYFCLL
jgi:hypothetical protein